MRASLKSLFVSNFKNSGPLGKWVLNPHFFFLSIITGFAFLSIYLLKRRLDEVFLIIPIALFATAVAIKDVRHLWMAGVFFLPLSIELSKFIQGAALTFPTDLVALVLFGFFFVKIFTQKTYHFPQFKHPLFYLIFASLAWMLITSIQSEIPLVSFKWWAASLWLVGGFWLVTSILFYRLRLMYTFVILIGVSFALVVLFIFVKYGVQGRNIFGLRINPTPLFKDHTIFGTFPTLFIPFFTLFTFSKQFPKNFRIFAATLLFFLILGLFFSYSRGAWASSFVSLILLGMFLMREQLKKKAILIIGICIIFLIIVVPGMLNTNSRNKAVSRKDLSQHILSITNFRTDASNSERLNRWASSAEMFSERPLLGFGPGTYAFVYAPFQKAKFRTLESTNRGDIGTAHNEFLLAFCEQGILGGVLSFALFLLPIFMGLRGYIRAQKFQIGILYLGASFGLIAYFLHAWVNNFLDQDKIGVPFYVYLAMITALDVYFFSPRPVKESGPKKENSIERPIRFT